MSKVIQVLETMASNASLVSEEDINTFLTTAEINTEQQQAITAKNVEQLAETIADLPKIIAHIQVLPAEDDEPIEDDQENDQENDNSASSKLLASSF